MDSRATHIRRLKESGPERFPFADLDANRAWMAVVCFAADLVRWFQLLCVTSALAAAEPKALRWGLWHTPARIVRRARRSVVRILDGCPVPTPSSAPTAESPSSPERPRPSRGRHQGGRNASCIPSLAHSLATECLNPSPAMPSTARASVKPLPGSGERRMGTFGE